MNRIGIFSRVAAVILGLTCMGQARESIEPKMVLIPAGEFVMGKDSEKGYDFSPAHTVSVHSFYMDQHEVTNQNYLDFCKSSGYKYPEFWDTEIFRSGEAFLNYPVVGINWWDASKYAEWAGKRLPTEAEWEYAARGGLIEQEFPNGDQWSKPDPEPEHEGWLNQIRAVQSLEPNGYHLFDMGGNVWEWVADRYSADCYQTSPGDNPMGLESGSDRVIRGGSWHSGSMCKKVYYRKGIPGSWCDFAVGFRCAKDVGE